MRRKPLNNNPNSMHMIMENFRRFADEIETDDTVYLFEGKKVVKSSFDTLFERYDKNEITFDYLSETCNKSLLYEWEEIQELEVGKAIASGAKKVGQAVKGAVGKAVNKLKLFAFKALKQAIKLVVRAVKALSASLSKKKSVKEQKKLNELTKGQQLQAQIWIKCMQAIKMFMVGAAKASKFLGPPMIMLGGALLLLVICCGFSTAAAAGMPPDPDLTAAAADILQQTMEAMGESGIPGGEHASDVERTTSNMVSTSIDGEVITQIDDVTWEKSTSIVNERVRALNGIVSALHKKISSDGVNLDLGQIYETLSPEVQEEVNLALEAAQELKETDPGAYQEAVEAGRTIDVLWDGEVKSIIDDVMIEKASSVVDSETGEVISKDSSGFEHTRIQSQQAGQSYGARGVRESKKIV